MRGKAPASARTTLDAGNGDPGDHRALRDTLGRFATGVTVLSVGGGTPRAMTANSFTSVSLDPPLVLVCVGRSATMHRAIDGVGAFGVSVLGAGQERLARYFADRRRPTGAAQFEPVRWWAGPCTGAPLLSDSLAWLECEVHEVLDGGDHSIFLGRVLAALQGGGDGGDHSPLLFFEGCYRRLPDG